MWGSCFNSSISAGSIFWPDSIVRLTLKWLSCSAFVLLISETEKTARKLNIKSIHRLSVTVQVRNSLLLAVMEFAEIFPRNPKHFFRIGCFADFFKEGLLQLSLTASIGRSFPICRAGPEAARRTVRNERITETTATHGEKEAVIRLPVTSCVRSEYAANTP